MNNPYRIIIKVLKFARKHKYSLQRSAFTYRDDERPSRLDFAKERYGGPFTTEQVEDVKTLRIVVILLSLGPIFVMTTPASVVALPLIGLHVTSIDAKDECQLTWIWLYSGFLWYVVSTCFVPFYLWTIFVYMKHVSSIFSRLKLAIMLHFAGVFSILCIDLGGHLLKGSKITSTDCMFNITINQGELNFPSLDMHWSVIIPPNVLIGIADTLIAATVFEFISAQSPYSMKGILVGSYYATAGVFQLFSGVAVIPFLANEIHLN